MKIKLDLQPDVLKKYSNVNGNILIEFEENIEDRLQEFDCISYTPDYTRYFINI